jgi:hypothetical protein
MLNKTLLVLVLVVFVTSLRFGFCEDKNLSKEKIIAIATEAVKAKGIKIEAVNVIYDEGGRLWSEQIGKMGYEDKDPNHGILKKGFLKNYRIVYFDFKESIPDTWVFIDKDTGEVLEVYRIK